MQKIITLVLSCLLLSSMTFGMEYPGTFPGKAECKVTDDLISIQNAVIHGKWRIGNGKIISLSLENKQSGDQIKMSDGFMPRLILGDGQIIDLATFELSNNLSAEKNKVTKRIESTDESEITAWIVSANINEVTARFKDAATGISVDWKLSLEDGSNAIIQTITARANQETEINEIVFMDAEIPSAVQEGEVDGSVITCDNFFMGVEHPLARNIVENINEVRCALHRGNKLEAGGEWTYSSVYGVVPPGQLRRGFLYYLEQRRADPYRPFLHYNNWYNVYLARPVERTNEKECLETIELFGEKLVGERGVKMDAFVWDDGWDDFNSLWDFHKGFPDGFKNLVTAANKYDVAQGVWMSPWGGYATAKKKRIAYGESKGYETNDNGFSMAGEKYGKAFRDVCLKMMREEGVVFFKFDGMGGGNKATGASAEKADDIDAVLDLTLTLRKENPELFISATIGTWPSPFWLKYASSIWRQGGDNGMYGEGDTRQQWITYRDMNTYERIVQLGPLYPMNSLMLGGIIIGDREGRAPSKFVRNEKSVADEIWSFFGSGTNLQELYIDPTVLTENMWDVLAEAAKWSRNNSNTLVDTHWIGGDPAEGEVYGWASWSPEKGIVVLRNPSKRKQEFSMTVKEALELPEDSSEKMLPSLKYPRERDLSTWPSDVNEPFALSLQPFEVIVIELVK